jgi:rare lipoprotein A
MGRGRLRHVAVALALHVTACGQSREMRFPEGPNAPVADGAAGDAAPATGTELPNQESATSGIASYYAQKLAGRRTASGERYDPRKLTAAHRTLPFGTLVEVRRADGRNVVVRINDRGPFVGNRIIDLSHAAAEELGVLHDGTARVELRVVSSVAQKRP